MRPTAASCRHRSEHFRAGHRTPHRIPSISPSAPRRTKVMVRIRTMGGPLTAPQAPGKPRRPSARRPVHRAQSPRPSRFVPFRFVPFRLVPIATKAEVAEYHEEWAASASRHPHPVRPQSFGYRARHANGENFQTAAWDNLSRPRRELLGEGSECRPARQQGTRRALALRDAVPGVRVVQSPSHDRVLKSRSAPRSRSLEPFRTPRVRPRSTREFR